MKEQVGNDVSEKPSSAASGSSDSTLAERLGPASNSMSVPEFLDTNVLVYAYDVSEASKQSVAQALVKRAVAGEIVASSQVLAEFATTLLHKLSPPARPEDVITILDTLSPIRLVAVDTGLIRRAVEARATYGLLFWDGMIVAAAERAGCERLWSEDLNAGQKYYGVTVVNPFN
jgi:predicted nucleic acid-binding protein